LIRPNHASQHATTQTLHNLTMGDEICGVPLVEPGGRRAYAHRLGEWFTPCRWNNNTCHMEWARKSFHARKAPPPGSGPEHRGAVIGMHMYASSWTQDMSATAQRMRGQAREVGTCGFALFPGHQWSGLCISFDRS